LSSSIHITEMHQLPRPAQLIDVRSGSEFASGHIPGAVNIPMDQIEARLDDLRPGVPIILVCQTGKRARMTADLLEPCQRQISVLEGGTSAWIQAGLPVVTSVKTRWSLERQVRWAQVCWCWQAPHWPSRSTRIGSSFRRLSGSD